MRAPRPDGRGAGAWWGEQRSGGPEAVGDPLVLARDHLGARAMEVAHAASDRAVIALDQDDDRRGLLAVRMVAGVGHR